MPFNQSLTEELNLILKFPDQSLMQGLKVHHTNVIDAAKRLHQKGIISQPDGGYLTDLGHDLAEHAKVIQSALTHT
jgi:uncharacterized protein (TIGR02647 family)